MEPMHRPTEAAAIIQISPSSLRSWCSTFAAFLSPQANPGAGSERLLSAHDLAVLQRVKELRAQHKSYDAIISQLQSEDVASLEPYIELSPEPTADRQPPATIPMQYPTPTHAASNLPAEAAIQIVAAEFGQRFAELQNRIEVREKESASKLTHLGLGFVAGILVCVFVLLALWLVGGN